MHRFRGYLCLFILLYSFFIRAQSAGSKKDTIPVIVPFGDIDEKDVGFIEEGRRSKRIAVDSLMKIVKDREEGLKLSGQFLAASHWDGRFQNSNNAVVGIIDLFAISNLSENALAFVNLRGISGNGLNNRFTSFDTFHAGVGSTQDDDGVDQLTLFEAWVEYQWDGWTFTGGKLDLVNYFDANAVANDEYSQFLSYGFVNGLSFPVPPNSGALLVSKELTRYFLVSAAISSNDQNLDNAFDNIFRIVQGSFRLFYGGNQRGAIRAFIYDITASHSSLGYGFSADYRLFSKLYLYGRFGENNDALLRFSGYPVSNSVSGGFQLKSIKLGKKTSYSVGAAYGRSNTFSVVNEHSWESYVRFALFSRFFCSLHYQHVENDGEQANRDLGVWSLRTRIGF
jgi:hypothetical protein